jgi:mono/diheme cytochrome c family protein
MRRLAKMGVAGVGAVALVAIATVLFVVSGAYNIGADDHHTKVVLAIIEQLRERSIAVRAHAIEVPSLADADKIRSGAEYYAALCVGCHLAPGVTKSAIRAGLYPHPPNLGQEDIRDAQRAFWTIKHGIKMSAMPAWGKTLDDGPIWDLVAFVRAMPAMTPAQYQQLSSAAPSR